jgi:large subunit ribosomal protein L31e
MERIMIVNLRKVYDKPRTKRRSTATKMLREIIARHMKVNFDDVKIDNKVTKELYKHGSRKPLRKIKVKMTKDEKTGVTLVTLPEQEMKKEEKKKPEKQEKKQEKQEAEKKEEKKIEKTEITAKQ